MEPKSRRCIRSTALPSVGLRRYVQIYAKRSRKMLPSSPSPRARKSDYRSRSGTPSNATTPPSNELPELSDVQCYTCRRRHVRCDRILPHCAKCRKRGIQCLGYTKPLRWADGVAVRGKLKGKHKPVVDSTVVSIVQENVQQQVDYAREEAAHIGLHTTDNCCNDVVVDESHFMELMAYHNTTVCAEWTAKDSPTFIDQQIATLSYEAAQKLPRSIVNCILGIAAVHMAVHNPGNRALERLALETKVNVFQRYNRLLQAPPTHVDHRPDVMICSSMLIFAMDLFEHGMNRWMVHNLGSMNVISSLGGIENLSYHYPHLHTSFLHVSLFETMWVILSHVPITKQKQAPRGALELLCSSPFTKRKFFNPCAVPLTLAIWDMGACAQTLLPSRAAITLADMHKRERILLDVLSFQPQDGSKALRDEFFFDMSLTSVCIKALGDMQAAWKAAMTIIVLRYLFFGRANLVPHSQGRHSLHISFATSSGDQDLSGYLKSAEEFDLGEYFDEPIDLHTIPQPDYLSAGTGLQDPLSRSPSPLASPLHYTEPPPPNIWNSRYSIHEEAFDTLFAAISSLYESEESLASSYVLTPVFILGLVSRPQSKERSLCLAYLNKFKSMMTGSPTHPASPTGSTVSGLDIPWEKLDAFSAAEHQRQESSIPGVTILGSSAPEWNWWDMLKHIDMNMSWPVTSGKTAQDLGSEAWAFKLVASVVNEECFASWLNETNSSRASTSSA